MEDLPFISETKEGVLLHVKVIPNSSKNAVVAIENDKLKLRIQAPPDQGKANIMLIRYLSELLEIPKRSIELVKGETSQHKLLLIQAPKNLLISQLSKVLESLHQAD